MDSEDGNICKKVGVKEMEALEKKYAPNMVEFLVGRKHIARK